MVHDPDDFNILVRNDTRAPLLVVEVKRRQGGGGAEARERLRRMVWRVGASFVMVADADRIVVAPAIGSEVAWERGVAVQTRDVVAHYVPTKDPATMELFLLESVIGAWLRDFALHWHSAFPPGRRQLESIGLGQLLEGSDVATRYVA